MLEKGFETQDRRESHELFQRKAALSRKHLQRSLLIAYISHLTNIYCEHKVLPFDEKLLNIYAELYLKGKWILIY